ncbi:MAG: hypothetical protein GWN00_04000 [Aliifodinibius sp.]|nr:hypothetical protein [Fodinibius sp.]NIW98552.1 hypothetical protein [Phycisphaerae bacterium]NIY23997.1 hypothetical protein [Fodinibius sp.]
MALLTEGYWQATYFPSSYWQTSDQYWLEYDYFQAETSTAGRNRLVEWYLELEAKWWL